ncbi:hypothetical protein BJY52DRAFT_1212082 [Lactarius psammicola]|nr:hypothetical protein BJY52DRAFT_1212082 [Lactarius psammicola]
MTENYDILPLTTTFRPERGSEKDCAPWVSATHPDGALYFFDPARRLFTDTDMHEPGLRRAMEDFYLHLQTVLRVKGPPSKNYDLVLDLCKEGEQMQCSYYYACHKTRCLFWLEPYNTKDMLSEVSWVAPPAHLKHRLEAFYWSHWSLYPALYRRRRLKPAIYDELVGILTHGCMDVMTSKSSTLPYDEDTMKKMLDLVRNAKESNSNLMYHTAAVTRLLSFFAHWRFLYFHGQKTARLDKHQTVHSEAKRERTLFITLLSPLLFLAPEVHLQEIDKLWTDGIIIDAAWKSFVPKLLEEWQELILLSTVMLSANVGFLAIPAVVLSNLNNNITNASQVVIFTSPAQIASYMSMEASVGSIVIGLLLVRHNRSKQKEDPAGASTYLIQYTHPRFGLEPMAIIYSLPWALLMWAMVMFFIALMLVCFRISNLPTRVFIAVISVMVTVLVWWCILWSWRSGDSGKLWYNSLPLSIRRALGAPRVIIRLMTRRAHQSSPA